MPRKKRKQVFPPYATLLLIGICVFAYLLLSGGEPYVYPLEKLDALGVALSNPFGAVTYAFLHVGVKHLIGNAIVLLAMGIVVERVLGWKDTLGIYLTSGIGAGLAYIFLYPNALVIGSSAAISGFILAGYVVDVKKAFLVLAAALLLIPAVVYPNVDAGLDWFTASREAQEIEIVVEEQLMQEQLLDLRAQIEAGNATAETIALEQNMTIILEQVKEKRKQASQKKVIVVVGRAREEATPVSFEIHVLGMLMAGAYLFIYRKDAFHRLRDDMNNCKRWAFGLIKS